MNHWVVIPAAGVGARMQADRPKQNLPLHGKTVIEHTLACFTHHPAIAGIVVAISDGDPYWGRLHIDSDVQLHVARGGIERCHSVLNALHTLSALADDNDWVLVHDAARPCLGLRELQRMLDTLAADEVGGILGVPVADTLKRADVAGRIQATEPREHLWQAQTPQMFRHGLLLEALSRTAKLTDEAGAVEALGLKPKLVQGASSNLKVTYTEDLLLAQTILTGRGAQA